MFDGEIGAERFRLTVPALPLPDYVRLQGLLLGPLRTRRRPKTLVLAWLAMVVAVVAIITASDWLGLFGVLILGAVRFSSTYSIPDTRLVLLVCGLSLVIAAVLIVLGKARHRGLLRRLHAGSRTVNSPYELVLGEAGVRATSPATRLAMPWSTVTAHVAASGTHFLVIDGVSALWLPESVFPSLMERDALLAFLAEKVGRPA